MKNTITCIAALCLLGTATLYAQAPINTVEYVDINKIKLSSTVGSEAWNSRDLKSRPH